MNSSDHAGSTASCKFVLRPNLWSNSVVLAVGDGLNGNRTRAEALTGGGPDKPIALHPHSTLATKVVGLGKMQGPTGANPDCREDPLVGIKGDLIAMQDPC